MPIPRTHGRGSVGFANTEKLQRMQSKAILQLADGKKYLKVNTILDKKWRNSKYEQR